MEPRIRSKRYWYFVTQDFMGNKMDLFPRIPHSMSDDEPHIKRICVAPTAAHCLSAICVFAADPIYVYRTVRRVYAEKAWNVGDAALTNEHFLRRRSKFELVSVISPEWIRSISERGAFRDRGYNKNQPGYTAQRLQKEQVVRSVVKLDRRLGIISESDTRFHYEGEQKLLGKDWPEQNPWNDMNTRGYVLEMLGLAKKQGCI